MKRILFISEGCYAHLDRNLLPVLNVHYEIVWGCFFNHFENKTVVSEYEKAAASLNFYGSKVIQLSSRMCSLQTRKELKDLLMFLKKTEPNIVYVNADGFPFLPLLVRKVFKKNPCIVAIHDVKAHSHSRFITKLYKTWLPYFYEYKNVLSCYSLQLINHKIFIGKNIFCCKHPFIDFGEMKQKAHTVFTVLFFGNLLKYKGIDLLIDAGKKAYSENNKICIKICGKGSDEYLLDSCKNHPAFRIINRYVDDSEIPDIFSDVDCLALPYTDATQSGPMAIALNYNIPVLATDINAFKVFSDTFSEVHLIKNNSTEWKKELLKYASSFPNSFKNIQKYKEEIDTERKSIERDWIQLFSVVGEKL